MCRNYRRGVLQKTMYKGKTIVVIALIGCLISACQNRESEEGAFARVGNNVITQEEFDAFGTMKRMYPEQMHEMFPGSRGMPTFVVETEALYQNAPGVIKRSIKKTDDWKWKRRYFPAQLYMQEILEKNLGFTDKQLQAYYNAHKQDFLDTVKIPSTTARDTGDTGVAGADSLRDSVFVRSFEDVHYQIAQEMFLDTYPPDSAFWAEMSDTGEIKTDSSVVRDRWLRAKRNELPQFFMRQLYEQEYGEPLPDSLDEWYGEGKPITPANMEVILGWLPEARRESYRNESGYRYLAEWLLKWKLFSDKAQETGFADSEQVQRLLDWSLRYETAKLHLVENIAEQARDKISIDTAMAVYAYWDDFGTPGVAPDSAALARELHSFRQQIVEQRIDKRIFDIRQDVGVEFLQSDWKDQKGEEPQTLMAEADSLVNANETRKAENVYRTIVRNFGFTETGHKAMTELAKMQTENAHYREAIDTYRRQLVLDPDLDARCNTFFMIGFIYDEYLNKEQRAEVNYKWILEHTPQCELADDAEFMVQHLGEPMTSVEDLRAEARRQGRDIEDEPETTELLDTVVTEES